MTRTMRFLLPVFAVALGAGPAQAARIVGGDTRVLVESAFVGLVGGVTGTASVFSGDPLIANFPISGGTLDSALAGAIRHDGVGLTLTNGTNVVGAGNFVIDTVAQRLFGDVTLNGTPLASGLALFSFDLGTVSVAELTDLANPKLALLLTSEAAGALEAAFGVQGLTGAQFGRAATAPALAAIPEPATWGLMILGFGAIGHTLRRRRAAVAVA